MTTLSACLIAILHSLIFIYSHDAVLAAIFTLIGQSIILGRSLSMSFMLAHNKKEYVKSLKVVHNLRLNCLCCKWKHFVLKQLEDLVENVKMMSMEHNKGKEGSLDLETTKQSIRVQNIEINE